LAVWAGPGERGAGRCPRRRGALDLGRLVQHRGLAGLHLGLALRDGGLERRGIDARDELVRA
jgi:hypothetical protein